MKSDLFVFGLSKMQMIFEKQSALVQSEFFLIVKIHDETRSVFAIAVLLFKTRNGSKFLRNA